MNTFIREYLFSALLNFKNRYFKLSAHTFIMSVRQVFTEIQVVINMSVVKFDSRERTLFIVFILQKHIVLLLVLLYSNKSRPFAVFLFFS